MEKGISLGLGTSQYCREELLPVATGEPVATAGRADTEPVPPHLGLPVTLSPAGNFTLRESFAKAEHSYNCQIKVLVYFQLKSEA